MDTIISHKTAFKYYRYFRNNRYLSFSNDLPLQPKLKIPEKCMRKNIIFAKQEIENLINERKIDFLIRENANIHIGKDFVQHSTHLKYPKDSFRVINDGLYIPCPEMLFYQLSQILKFSDLMLAGLELCGSFTISKDITQNLTTDINQVTSKTKIINFLNKLHAQNSHAQSIWYAKMAAHYLADGSNSPQESRLFIMLCGPRRYGGYGIKNMLLNQGVKLSNKSKKILNQNFIYPDICNKDKKIAIEYDSKEFHDNTDQNTKDKLRIDVLQRDGWRVISFVGSNTYNIDALHIMALDILNFNGQDKRIHTRNFEMKRNQLHSELYKMGETLTYGK